MSDKRDYILDHKRRAQRKATRKRVLYEIIGFVSEMFLLYGFVAWMLFDWVVRGYR